MEVEQPSSVLPRMSEDDPDIQVEEPPLKKICLGLQERTTQTACAPLGPSGPGDGPHAKDPLVVSLIGNKYLLMDQLEGSSLYFCLNVHTKEDLVCKMVSKEKTSLLTMHHQLDAHPHVNALHEVLIGDKFMYLMFEPSYGDMHSHVRHRKRLHEDEAREYFRQMVEAVRACHDQGIVLRDLKLRKFVFADAHKTEVKLETMEDAILLEDPEDDILREKRGCPAYVSPEILRRLARYSGRAADMWSLGVILYTMLVGRYPFNDNEHASLFAKINRGHFVIPECVSPRAKCLIRSLLRREPSERLSAGDVLMHPWLSRGERHAPSPHHPDQQVPDCVPL